jgi:hypothetical protein
MIAARRLAAIPAVDFVGYSRLMGEDEAVRADGSRTLRGARCSQKMPRQDSQVTADGHLEARPEPTRTASESPESLRIDFGRWTPRGHTGG